MRGGRALAFFRKFLGTNQSPTYVSSISTTPFSLSLWGRTIARRNLCSQPYSATAGPPVARNRFIERDGLPRPSAGRLSTSRDSSTLPNVRRASSEPLIVLTRRGLLQHSNLFTLPEGVLKPLMHGNIAVDTAPLYDVAACIA